MSNLNQKRTRKKDDQSDQEDNEQSNKNNNNLNNEYLQLRSYEDFIQQSVEVGSYINFNTNEYYHNKKQANSNSNQYSSSNQLVLIKYKKSNENDSDFNSLRANQLQKRREIHSLLLFIFFLFVTIITLSQILVMHSQTNNSNFYQIKLMQEELKLMDLSIDKMLKEGHVLPMQVWIALKQFNDSLKKFSNYMGYLNDSYIQNNETISLADDVKNCSIFFNSNLTFELMGYNENLELIKKFNLSLIDFEKAIFLNSKHLLNESNNLNNNVSYKKCLQLFIVHLFYIYNQKYSQIIESNPKFKIDTNLVEETVKFLKDSNYSINLDSNSVSLLNNIQLRNLNDFSKKYLFSKNIYLKQNKTLCDAQPPILCKLIEGKFFC